MGKPRAARKKAVVLSDSDQDEPRSPPPKRPRRGTLKGASSTAASSTAKSPVKSPAKSPGKPTPIYKPITSFFSNAPRLPKAQPTPSPEKPTTPLEDIDDILDSSTDEDRPSTRPAALPVRKGIKTASSVDNDNVGKGSQKFRFASGGARSTPPPPQLARQDTVDRRPWTEKYGPVSLDELAVHKRKVADVRTWLSNAFSGRERKRLLLLKGPAGSGKTTTMSLLSKELGFEMHEWKNPTNSMSSSEGFTSATAQFEDFVGRTGAFGSLSFDEPATARPQGLPDASSSRQKQLILVEEFPNTFTRTSSVVQNFRTAILNYLAANTPSATAFFSGKTGSEQPVTPIVMIVSETLLSTNTAAADSFTAHRLLGPDILTHPGVTVIEFNPIAPTYMTKALEQIVLKEARKSGRRKTVGPQVIQRLSELGDIRSALSSLEFLCLRGDESDGWGAKVNFTKKKSSKDVPLTEMEQESLEMVTQRESTLGIFHAVGRVLYNKRLPEDPSHPVPQPPNWFPERRRPKASEVNVDSLIDELGTDTQTFIAALHENYVLSCGGADSEETMDSVDGCIESLSDADLLSPDRFSRSAFGGRNFQGTSSDNLRQDEMSFQTSVRGLLYNLPNPVKRLAPPPGIMGMKAKGAGAGAAASKGSAFVMYYPASLRLWKQQEEVGGLLEMWISRAQRGELLGASSLSHKPTTVSTGGVDTWRKTTPFAQSTQTPSARADTAANEPPPPVLLGSGGSARNEMLLERLPYLPIILRQSRMPSTSLNSTIREIQKITSFTKSNAGFASTEGDPEDDLEEPTAGEHEQWATDKPATETPRKKRRVMISSKKDDASSGLPGIGEKMAKGLVLSDDDIED